MNKLADKWKRGQALKIREILERVALCGCGTAAHWEIIFELLQRAENHAARGSFYNFFLQPNDKQGGIEDVRDPWVEFGAKVLDSWDLIEHGTGIGWAWLTDDGKLLLEFLRDFGTENSNYEDNSGHPSWSCEFSWGETPKPNDTYSEWELQ